MHILDLLAKPRPLISFEFFPPKSPADRARLLASIPTLGAIDPAFLSITYGAGGSTRDLTLDLVETLHLHNPVPHLTCVSHTHGEIRGILTRHATAGVSNILALRGDMPRGHPGPPGDFKNAADLVAFIRTFSRHSDPRGFGIGIAAYPEGHPATPNRLQEMDHLKAKVDAGADYIVTQLFFDNHDFHDFRDRCDLAGIRIPIIAGILPLTNLAQMARMADLAGGARFPAKLLRSLERAGSDPLAIRQVGIHHAASQCADLLDHHVAGIHFYTLNRPEASLDVCSRIGLTNHAHAA